MKIKHREKISICDFQKSIDSVKIALNISDDVKVAFTLYANFYTPDGDEIEFIGANGDTIDSIQLCEPKKKKKQKVTNTDDLIKRKLQAF